MKKFSLLTLLLIILISFQNIFAQNSCKDNKTFQKGEKVYIWGSKEWGSSEKAWKEYDYDGKEGDQYKLKKVVGNSTSTMNVTSLQDVFSASEYAKLDKSRGACASCTASYISEYNKESLKLINDYRAKSNVAALKQDPVLQKAAQDYVNWMVKNVQSHMDISHTADGTEVKDRVLKAAKSLNAVIIDDKLNGKYAFKGVGENLTSGRLCAFDAFESWRTSTSGHDWQMKNGGHKYVGMGVACGTNSKGQRIIFAAQVFGGEKAVQENNSTPITPSTTTTSTGTEVTKGNSMATNQRIYSPNKQHYLVMQSDGNLVVYTKNNKPTWATDTYGKGNGCRLDMQTDGHLVIYNANNRPIWASGTHSSRNAKYAQKEWKPVKMVFTNDGFVTLISATGKVVWTSKNSKGERL